MTLRLSQLPCLLATLATLAVAGCGDDGEPEGRRLPPETSQTLMQQLESVGERVAAGIPGACDDIYSDDPDVGNIEPIDAALSSVPADVDPEIRSALEQSIERLVQLVDQECSAIRSAEQEEQDTIEDEDEEEPPPETVETETTPTETTETTPAPPETTPTERDAPSSPQDGRGPNGTGPPGQEQGGAEAPDDEGGG